MGIQINKEIMTLLKHLTRHVQTAIGGGVGQIPSEGGCGRLEVVRWFLNGLLHERVVGELKMRRNSVVTAQAVISVTLHNCRFNRFEAYTQIILVDEVNNRRLAFLVMNLVLEAALQSGH